MRKTELYRNTFWKIQKYYKHSTKFTRESNILRLLGWTIIMGVLFFNFAFNLSVCQLPFWNITVNPCIRSRVLCDQPFRYYGEGNSKCTLKSSGFGLFFSDHSLNGKHFLILINCSHSDWGLQVQSMDLTTAPNSHRSLSYLVHLLKNF